MKVFIILCCIAYVSGRKVIFGTPGDPFADFANDHDVLIPEDDPNKPPTDFRGNVMKAKITNNENTNNGKGRFRYAIETENGIAIAQGGKLKSDGKTFIVHGSFAFTGADGRRYRTRYTADERGYHPVTELEEIEIPDFEPIAPVKPVLQTNLNTYSNFRFINNNALNDVPDRHYLPPSTAPPPINRSYLPPVTPAPTARPLPPVNPSRSYLPPVGYVPPPSSIYNYY